MKTIDLRDLLTQFTQRPLETLRVFFEMALVNGWENIENILLIVFLTIIFRAGTFRLINGMVPNPKNPKQGHLLRRFFLSKITDNDGRLLKRFGGSWWKDSGRLIEKEDAYYSRRTERAAGLASLFKSMFNLILMITSVFMILAQIGVTMNAQTSTWLLGSFGVAIALGAQNLIKDIIGGIHVLAEDQYGLGDYVDAQFGVAGIVTHIGLRTTRLKGADGTIYHIRHSEMPKVGNRTQATGNLIIDIQLTWNDLPEGQKMVQPNDLHDAEESLAETIRELRKALNAVERVATSAPVPDSNEDSVPLNRVAELVPDLVPHLSDTTLTNITAIANKEEAAEPDKLREDRSKIVAAINKVPNGIPLFQDIEMLGLVNSEAESVTLRVKIKILSQGSRSYALSVLRRKVFEDFAPKNISTQFEEVPEGAIFQ